MPHSARVWNYWLGGKDNFPADRQVGDQVARLNPGIVTTARICRAFLVRSVRFLAGEAEVRQFLDVGTGLPTAENTHQVAQRVAPDARVVYVDNDPLVLAHARALLTSAPKGATRYLDADLRDPGRLLGQVADRLDFTRPIALMLMGIMGHFEDYLQAREIVDQLVRALPSGSYLAMYDGTDVDEAGTEAMRRYSKSAPIPYVLRSPQQIAGFFDSLEPVEPGLVPPTRWRPADGDPTDDRDAGLCGVARKP